MNLQGDNNSNKGNEQWQEVVTFTTNDVATVAQSIVKTVAAIQGATVTQSAEPFASEYSTTVAQPSTLAGRNYPTTSTLEDWPRS